MNSNLDENTIKLVQTEVAAMSSFEHQNVLRYIFSGPGEYVKDNGKKREVNYLVLEIAEGGELFDYIAETGAFTEREARYFFK